MKVFYMPEFASGSDNVFSSCASNIWLVWVIFKDSNYNFVFNSITSTSSVSSKTPKLLSENALYLTFHFFWEPHIMAFTLFLWPRIWNSFKVLYQCKVICMSTYHSNDFMHSVAEVSSKHRFAVFLEWKQRFFKWCISSLCFQILVWTSIKIVCQRFPPFALRQKSHPLFIIS